MATILNAVTRIRLRELAKELCKWRSFEGQRLDSLFPWRESEDPFEWLVAEILLQKAPAPNVVPIWQRLLASYPTPRDLAKASEKEIANIIKPLGLHRIRAKAILQVAALALSQDLKEWLREATINKDKRPYRLGRYSISILASVLLGQETGAVDSNVARVLGRFFSLQPGSQQLHQDEKFWQLAGLVVRIGRTFGCEPKEINLAMVDVGRMYCRPKPLCDTCPLANICAYARK